MEDNLLIAKTIKEKRLLLNLTMDYVAKKVNITRATLWSIEKGDIKCSFKTIMDILNLLDLKIMLSGYKFRNVKRSRATRINNVIDKKINRFVIMCIEQYASSVNKKSSEVYNDLNKKGIINHLTEEYEDLHGMSTMYLNDYINSLSSKKSI